MSTIFPIPVELEAEGIDQLIPMEVSVNNEEIDLDVSTPIIHKSPESYNELLDKPSINGIELTGNKTSADLGIDQTFIHNQNKASDEWRIVHNLSRYPSVTVVDSAGTVVVGDVQYISENEIVIDFIGAFSGTAYLN